MTCWAAIDPETLVISTMTNGETRIPPEYEPRLAESEYSPDEPHTFAALASAQTRRSRSSRTCPTVSAAAVAGSTTLLAPARSGPGVSGPLHHRRNVLGRGRHGAGGT